MQKKIFQNQIYRLSEFQYTPSIQQQSSVGSGISDSADESLPKASSDEKIPVPMDISNPQISFVINKNDSIEEEVEPPEKAMKKSVESIAEEEVLTDSMEVDTGKTDDKVRKASSGSIGHQQKALKTCTCSKSRKEPVERSHSVSTHASETPASRPTSMPLVKQEEVVSPPVVTPAGPSEKSDKEKRKSISKKQSTEKEPQSRESSLEDAGRMLEQQDEHYKELTQQQISQDEEYEIAMGSGLLPGRVVSF